VYFTSVRVFFAVKLFPFEYVIYIFEDCIFYVLGVLFGHSRYYLTAKQANVTVICVIH
jgi:hypothetical protein